MGNIILFHSVGDLVYPNFSCIFALVLRCSPTVRCVDVKLRNSGKAQDQLSEGDIFLFSTLGICDGKALQ